MEAPKWYFSKEQLDNTPSRKCGITAEKELSYRQQSAKLIQDMGQRLQVNQLAINTGIVYMHRFYMYHTFSRFHRHNISPAALFLAAKVEEQPRKLEHVIKVASCFISHTHHSMDTQSELYHEKAQELVMNENILLQTLGFDVAIDHPHTYVVKCFQMIRALSNLPQTSYFMATNSLHMTTMCLQYRPSVVACVCIDIVCRWSNYEIQRFHEGREWFVVVDPTVTAELLQKITAEFIAVLDKFPNRLKRFKSMNSVQHGVPSGLEYRAPRHSNSLLLTQRSSSGSLSNSSSNSLSSRNHETTSKEAGPSKPHASSSQQKTVISHKEYNEKREKERRERERNASQISSSHPVSSSSQRAHSSRPSDDIDQLRMPPPQAVPHGRAQSSHNREPHPRKEHIPNDKHEKLLENHEAIKCHDNSSDNRDSAKSHDKISDSVKIQDKISENHETAKILERTKHTITNPKIEKVEIKPIKQETSNTKLSAPVFHDARLPMKENQHATDGNQSIAASLPLSTAVIKKEHTPHNVSQNSGSKTINSNIPISFYHPRLDGKSKQTKETLVLPQPSGERGINLPKSDKYSSKEDVISISSISKLISQSITKPAKETSDLGPGDISSTSHISKKHKSEHSHKHEKDKKKKKNKHKSKDKKEKHKEKESKEHKKSKKQKKHKEKDKERDREAKHVKSIFDVDEEDVIASNTPLKLTIIRDKGVFAPETQSVPIKTHTPTSTLNSSVGTPSSGTGGLKITIPKSRLQANISKPSPPRGIPPRDSNTPNVKLKIPKEKLKYEKESRKRDRSPLESQQPNKYIKTSGGINIQQVLDCPRWNSQGP